jgi:hypothetical protein|tara:strand:+ start:282 stop:485 length:204 start_codon:yes stop_codon:yes gene_type:complete
MDLHPHPSPAIRIDASKKCLNKSALVFIVPGRSPERQSLNVMGKQHNKVIKRKRRKAYLKRKRASAK